MAWKVDHKTIICHHKERPDLSITVFLKLLKYILFPLGTFKIFFSNPSSYSILMSQNSVYLLM